MRFFTGAALLHLQVLTLLSLSHVATSSCIIVPKTANGTAVSMTSPLKAVTLCAPYRFLSPVADIAASFQLDVQPSLL